MDRSDHCPGIQRRRAGPCTGMHLLRDCAHLHTHDLRCVPRIGIKKCHQAADPQQRAA